ncbi:FAD-dependent oxidoreductase [Paracoccus seriniphilus]|uniref:Sarcosine oxidase subunit beta n=1 Tax=Paracoccus seriniphilus TaxID=184748 RepID=A0A239Q220_9RHOB|nr:FAD-dependent oxidoreductase [Paracoccus seriniphilus]WCR16181.1 FAD-dependent oxidoreductase [Paracoccus seriniphilus]SNT76554.1 sarcosine oxidase subunit beta [Paracoccus seriniphilus]
MKQRYSVFSLVRNAFSSHENWSKAWRSPPLKPAYDVIIIGAGGHGLATAYYLAREFGITNVAVLEKGWLGGGNIARNTVTIRSNYMRDESIPFYVKSVEMFEGLTRELNFNMMHSKRSMIDVVQTYGRLRELRRRQLAMDIHGATYQQITTQELRRRIPALTGGGANARLPIIGGMVHTDAAVNRHDAVAWGYARGADSHGVEIHQQTEVTALIRGGDGAIAGVETNRGTIRAKQVVVAVSGHTTTLTETAGLRLPLRTMNLTAFVSEPVKPLIDVIVNCPDSGFYLSQSDKGEMVIGGAPDRGQSFRRDIKQHVFEDSVSMMLSLFPAFKKLKLMRQWGGHLDIAHDSSPIMSLTDVAGLIVTAGWWGGYKAIPAGGLTLAHLVAKGTPHPLMAAFTLNRFKSLDYVMESGTTTAR